MNYQLTIHPALENTDKSISINFNTAQEMIAAKDTSSMLLLFIQDELKVMKDYSNMLIMEELIDGEWMEYDDL